MIPVINIINCFQMQKDRILLTESETHVPNLRLIANACTRKTVQPLDRHIHKDCMEFVIVVKGKQTYHSEEHDYVLSGGDVFISFLDQPHGSGDQPQEMNEIFWFQIDMRYQDGFLGSNPVFGAILYAKLASLSTPVFKISSADIGVLKEAFRHFCFMNDEENQIGCSLFVAFLNRLIAKSTKTTALENEFCEVLSYIDTHIYEPLNITALCKFCYLSESRFKHKFTEKIGMTPIYYINLKKIEIAKTQLLSASGFPPDILSMALSLGYGSSSYFSTVFKKYTGQSPLSFWKTHKTE